MNQPHIEEAIRRILSRRRGNVPGPCPDANELAAFLEAHLTPDETARFEEHAADCAACQEALALSLQLDAAEESIAVPAAPEPRSFTYRTSPIRLVFAAAVVVVVGALLFQATRQSQQPMQKPQIAARQNQYDVSVGPGAAMSSKETRTPPTAAPAASVGVVSTNATGMPAQAQSGQPAPKPQPVTPPAAVSNQLVLEAGNLARPQAPAYADASKLAVGENTKADLQQRVLLNADNKALKMEMAANRPEEAKMKAEAVSRPSSQIAQQVNPAIQQTAQLNQQAALDQVSAIKAQATVAQGERGGGVVLQAADEKKRVEPDQKTQNGQQAQPAKAAIQAGDKRILALRSSVTDAKDNRVSLALEEARLLMTKDPAGNNAKKIGQRLLYRTPNYWVDAGCVAHTKAPAHEIVRDSKDYADILAKEPDLAQLHASGVPILLFWNGVNYLIR
jgi:hypothetical protein